MTTTQQSASKKPLKRDDGNGWSGRTYTLDDGTKVPSVTTILGVINKPALVPWAAKVEREAVIKSALDLHDDMPEGVKKMTRIAYENSLLSRITKEKAYSKQLSAAGEIGTQIHGLIEWNLHKELGHVVGPEPIVKDKALWGFMVYEEWRKKVNFRPKYIEQQVWSRKHRYAGTTDWLAWLQAFPDRPEVERLTVGDWKSGKAIYDEALMQVAAYVMALIEMGHAEGPIDGCIVRLPKVETDPEPEMRVIPWEEIPYLFKHFLAARDMHGFCSMMKSGEPIPRIEQPALVVPQIDVAEQAAEVAKVAEVEPVTPVEVPSANAPTTEVLFDSTKPMESDILVMTDEQYTAWFLNACATQMPIVKRAMEVLNLSKADAKDLRVEQRSALRLTVEDYIRHEATGAKLKKGGSRGKRKS